MAPALILTEDAAAEHGFSGGGPFTFPGFPGVYMPGRPLAVSELDLVDPDGLDELLEESGVPLERTDVEEGEGLAERYNHALSTGDPGLSEAEIEKAEDEAGVATIRTHAQADAVGAELGITFADGAKVADKVDAIEAYRANAGEPRSEMTPAPGAEETTPGEGEAGQSGQTIEGDEA